MCVDTGHTPGDAQSGSVNHVPAQALITLYRNAFLVHLPPGGWLGLVTEIFEDRLDASPVYEVILWATGGLKGTLPRDCPFISQQLLC